MVSNIYIFHIKCQLHTTNIVTYNMLVIDLVLHVTKDSLERFTTLLQGGVQISTTRGESLGIFLDRLPGFTMEYIVDRVQTIFLDGNAIDDLQTPLNNDENILAISAAMPGLAGAIFRMNSLHAALRTKGDVEQMLTDDDDQILVTLKLFNMIAQERGGEILKRGVFLSGNSISNFLSERPTLFNKILGIKLDGKTCYPDTILSEIDTEQTIKLTITTDND